MGNKARSGGKKKRGGEETKKSPKTPSIKARHIKPPLSHQKSESKISHRSKNRTTNTHHPTTMLSPYKKSSSIVPTKKSAFERSINFKTKSRSKTTP
jgi:hypothetical protein